MRNIFLFAVVGLLASAVCGEQVHVCQDTLAGGVRTRLCEETVDVSATYSTLCAPSVEGYIFTHWSVSAAQSFTGRDRFGRALEIALCTPAGDATLTANYLPSGQDSDGDGMADGLEVYWYGDISKDSSSDTDGDGWTFAEEVASGTNPLIKDESQKGGVVWRVGDSVQYNPTRMPAYVVRSEPEGVLFETISDYVEQGAKIPVPYFHGNFAYWTVNGVRQADRHGRAKDSIAPVMADEPLEIVAVAEDDEAKRLALYWYGTLDVDTSSDTDGDGWTFAEEIASGTNPLIKDESQKGGVVWKDEIVEGNVETTADGWLLDAETAAKIRTICGPAVKRNTSVTRIVVKGESEVVPVAVKLGIEPALEQGGSDLLAIYGIPGLRILAFDPQHGRVRIKVTPGGGNYFGAALDTGCINVYGAETLAEEMWRITGADVDTEPYLKSETKGEAELSVDLGNYNFIKVKATLDGAGKWQTVTDENKAQMRFFRVEVQLP